MKVLICGHTGATGSIVMDELINATWVESIVTIGRRVYEKYKDHPKVHQIVVSDMRDLSEINRNDIGQIDLAFDFVATSLKEAFKGEELYRIADVDMATEFAKIAKEAGAAYMCAISMKGADTPSEKKHDYAARAKHDMQENLCKLNFEHLAIMQPDWLNRNNDWKELLYTFGGLQGIKVADMAKCIIWSARNQAESYKTYSVKEMKQIAKEK